MAQHSSDPFVSVACVNVPHDKRVMSQKLSFLKKVCENQEAVRALELNSSAPFVKDNYWSKF